MGLNNFERWNCDYFWQYYDLMCLFLTFPPIVSRITQQVKIEAHCKLTRSPVTA